MATLIKRPGSPYYIAAFDVPQGGHLRHCMPSENHDCGCARFCESRIPEFRIAGKPAGRHMRHIVNGKNKAIENPVTPAPAKARVFQTIRLQPSTSDYETFAKTTTLAMGRTGRNASTPKPNTRLLSLLDLGA